MLSPDPDRRFLSREHRYRLFGEEAAIYVLCTRKYVDYYVFLRFVVLLYMYSVCF